MDSRKEICSNFIYQSYQVKDSFGSPCLPGWDRWKVGGEKTTSALKFLRTWYSGLQIRRKAAGESPIHENSLPMGSGLTIKSAKEVCVGIRPGLMEGRVSCLTSLPCDPPPAQRTTKRGRKQLRTRPCEFNKLLYWDYILLLEHIYLSSQKRSDEWSEIFCLTG